MKKFRGILLGFVALVLWCSELSHACNIQLYEKRFTSYNAMTDYTLDTSTSASGISCSNWCTSDQACVSFLFDAETSSCSTFSEYVQCEAGENMNVFYVKSGQQPKLHCACSLAYNSSVVNVALGKPVTLSSTMFGGGLLVDGNHAASMPCAHTDRTLNPYAMVDLQQSYNIYSFYLVNRADCCSERLHDLKILVGDDPNAMSVCIDYPATIGLTCTLRVTTLCQGRYVKFQIFTTEFLHICEAEVYSIV